MDERVLLYHLVQRVWPDRRAAVPKNLFQGYVRKKGRFRQALKEFKRWHRIDADLAIAFERRVHGEGKTFRKKYERLCTRISAVSEVGSNQGPQEAGQVHRSAALDAG